MIETKHVLTERQLREYQRDGFVVVRQMYSPSEMTEISAAINRLSELVSNPPASGGLYYLEDDLKNPGRRILSRIEKFAEADETLRKLIYGERMIATSRQLLGDAPVLFKEKINFKLAGGGGFKPHQDIQPGWDEYAPYFLSVLVTIDRSDETNGCLELAAGHHTRGMFGRKWKPLEGAELDGLNFVKYPMMPGDVAFFDCFTPHQSEANMTEKPRRNLYLTFNRQRDGDHRERYFADKRRSYPPDNEREPGKSYVFRV